MVGVPVGGARACWGGGGGSPGYQRPLLLRRRATRAGILGQTLRYVGWRAALGGGILVSIMLYEGEGAIACGWGAPVPVGAAALGQPPAASL